MARSCSLRSDHWPLKDQVQTYRPVGDAVLVRSNERSCGDKFPAIGTSAIDPRVQAAQHPLLAVAEDDHFVEVFPLHHLAPAAAKPNTRLLTPSRGDRQANCRRSRGPSG